MSFGGVYSHEYLVVLKKGEKACELLDEFMQMVSPDKQKVLQAACEVVGEAVQACREKYMERPKEK